MDEQSQKRSAPDNGEHSHALVPTPTRQEPQRNKCAQCGRPFGLVRRRRAGRQFCSAVCMDKQVESVRQAVRDRARWYEFLTQRG